MMLLILTIERYVSVCHPGFVRPVMGPPRYINNNYNKLHIKLFINNNIL